MLGQHSAYGYNGKLRTPGMHVQGGKTAVQRNDSAKSVQQKAEGEGCKAKQGRLVVGHNKHIACLEYEIARTRGPCFLAACLKRRTLLLLCRPAACMLLPSLLLLWLLLTWLLKEAVSTVAIAIPQHCIAKPIQPLHAAFAVAGLRQHALWRRRRRCCCCCCPSRCSMMVLLAGAGGTLRGRSGLVLVFAAAPPFFQEVHSIRRCARNRRGVKGLHRKRTKSKQATASNAATRTKPPHLRRPGSTPQAAVASRCCCHPAPHPASGCRKPCKGFELERAASRPRGRGRVGNVLEQRRSLAAARPLAG